MSALQTPWRASGLSAILGGGLLAVGWLLNVPRVTLPGEIAILFAHGFLILGVVGLYARQAEKSGKLGLCGLALAVLGGSTMIPGGAYFASLIPQSAEAISAATEHGIGGAISIAGALAFVVGYVVFGISVSRARILPRDGGVMLALGAILLLLGAGARLGQGVGAAGAVVMAIGFSRLGVALFRSV
jgi:hypothetical protein